MSPQSALYVAIASLAVAVSSLIVALFVWLAPSDAIGADVEAIVHQEIQDDVGSRRPITPADRGTVRFLVASSVANARSDAGDVETAVADLETRVAQLEDAIGDSSDADDLDARISGLRQDLQTLQGRIDQVDFDHGADTIRIDAELAVFRDDIDAAQGAADAAQQSAQAICDAAAFYTGNLAFDISLAC